MKAIVVDDDQRNREKVSQILRADGYHVEHFETADAAAVALSSAGDAVGLVVTPSASS